MSVRKAGKLAAAGDAVDTPEDRNALTARVFGEMWGCYNEPSPKLAQHVSLGLKEISKAARMSPPLITPRRRATVLILGNHSAGKSSFVNYYVEERVQTTGIAVESTGFTIIRSGRHEQEVQGEGALVDNEHIAQVAARLGEKHGEAARSSFVEHLTMCVRTSKAKQFESIDFIDTPGLCDGEVKYPFPVQECIVELAEVADLILVFLDPVGKAQVSRTVSIIKTLNIDRGKHHIMKFFITKADTAQNSQDITKVVAQVSQNLADKVCNTHGFQIPPMWIPQPTAASGGSGTGGGGSSVEEDAGAAAYLASRGFLEEYNGLHQVMSNMATCTRDCDAVLDRIDEELKEQRRRVAKQRRWTAYIFGLYLAAVTVGALAFFDVLHELFPAASAALLTHGGGGGGGGADATAAAGGAGTGMLGAVAATEAAKRLGDVPVLRSLTELSLPVVVMFRYLSHAFGAATAYNRLGVLSALFLLVCLFIQFFKCRSLRDRPRRDAEMSQLDRYQGDVEIIRGYVKKMNEIYLRAFQTPDYPSASVAAAARDAATSAQLAASAAGGGILSSVFGGKQPRPSAAAVGAATAAASTAPFTPAAAVRGGGASASSGAAASSSSSSSAAPVSRTAPRTTGGAAAMVATPAAAPPASDARGVRGGGGGDDSEQDEEEVGQQLLQGGGGEEEEEEDGAEQEDAASASGGAQ